MKSYRISAMALALLLASAISADASQKYTDDYLPGALYFQVIPDLKVDLPTEGAPLFGNKVIDGFMLKNAAYKVETAFPNARPPITGGADITRIYILWFPETQPVVKLCDELAKLPGVEYAEPWLLYHTQLEYNDPRAGSQYGLRLCQSREAHDLSTGNPDAIIAIVDTGIDTLHEDLMGNFWVNPGEDLNGNGRIDANERNRQDDDRNGLVDDFYGWSYVSNSNNIQDAWGHGTHCAGIASAVTNNNAGVASVGYDCSIMTVKAGQQNTIQYGYQGVQYAVDNGAHVISLSWGNEDSQAVAYNLFRYAHDHDVVVLAAAGNDNVSRKFYPAGYSNTISVAATDQQDHKSMWGGNDGSNYGTWIDISAPGSSIWSTIPGRNRYAAWDGTSMACPFAASVAILLRATYPDINADTTRALLLAGADPIDDLNPQYRGQLGAGRINAYRSLLMGIRPRLTLDDYDILPEVQGERINPGDTVHFVITISNDEEGEETEEIIANLATDDQTVKIQNPDIRFPNLQPGENYTNDEDPFILVIDEDATPHTTWMTVVIDAQPGEVHIEQEIEFVVGHPDILIIDDDGGVDFEAYYTEAFDNLSMGWVKWNVARDQAPPPMELRDYPMIIWFTGSSQPALDQLDRWQLDAAMNEGANILLIGQYIGDDPDNRGMLLDQFAAQHVADSVHVSTVEGLNGSPLGTDVKMLLQGAHGAQNGHTSPSTMEPVGAFGGDTLCLYWDSNDIKGIAGVWCLDRRNGAKRAYMGFSFEAVSGMAATTSREEVLQLLYNWFTGQEQSGPFAEDNQPKTVLLDAAYPNPFNSMVRLGYLLPASTRLTLRITDQQGREVSVLNTGTTAAGRHSIVWNAEGFPSGVYYANLQTEGGADLKQKLVLVK